MVLLPPVMKNLDPSLVTQCFEFIQSMAAQKVGKFSFKLTIGHSQFSFDSRESEEISARTSPAGATQCHKTPSKMRRNARRQEQFLRKKLSSPVPPASSSGTSMTSHLPDPELSRAGRGQPEKDEAASGDTKLSRLRSREDGKRLSYLTRRISTLKQQTEFNQRCIGMLTCFQPFNSIGLAKYGIEEDSLVRDKDGDFFRLPPEKCGFGFQDPEEPEDRKEALQCVMCNKPMTLDHQC